MSDKRKVRPIDANAADVEQITCYFLDHCKLEDVQDWLDEQQTLDVIPMDVHRKCLESEIKKRILAEKTNRQILENYAPVVHGRFEKQPEEIIPNLHVCPVLCKTCGTVYFTLNKSGMKELFCPYCGAKMDGGKDDENA